MITDTSYLRSMIYSDLREVLAIEELSFDNPWTEADFVESLRCRDVRAIVAMMGSANATTTVGGFVVAWQRRGRAEILNLAVRPSARLHGLGRRLVSAVALSRTDAVVRETNLPAQKFFRAVGFRAIKIDRDSFRDLGELGYVFNSIMGEKTR